ncbi:hypothetical protein D3C80_1143600 [compost metagenome]
MFVKVFSAPTCVKIVKVSQRTCFFFFSEIRCDDGTTCQFCGFLRTQKTLIFWLAGLCILQLVIVIGAKDERAVRPDGTGILPDGNHVPRINGHQDR